MKISLDWINDYVEIKDIDIEEILRVYGYDNIKGSPNKADVTSVIKNPIIESYKKY